MTDELHQYGKGGAVDQLTLICFIEALARSAELMETVRVTKILPNIFAETPYDFTPNVSSVVFYKEEDEEKTEEGEAIIAYAGSAMWISKRTAKKDYPPVHLSVLFHGLLTYIVGADRNMQQLQEKMAATKRNQVEALSYNETMSVIADIYQQKTTVDGEHNSHKHHKFRTLDEFITEFLKPLEKRALQLSIVEHKKAHIRIFWFGILSGWLKSKEYPYDKFASSYYLDILTHLFDSDRVGERLKVFDSNTMKNHVALEIFQAGVDRMCGDVIPEEENLDNTFKKLVEASFLDELSHVEKKVVKIDDGLDILIRFWYTAVRPQM